MNNNLSDLRFGDSDFATYLTMIGYEVKSIEVVEEKRHNNRIKAFIHFEGDREELINLHKIYLDGTVNINLKQFSINKQSINKTIKYEIDKYKQTHNMG